MTAVGKAAIIGTGTMGPGMGAVLERAGVEVALYDVSEEQLEKARPGVELARSVLDRLGEDGDGASGGSAELRFEPDLAAALDGADLVVEAVPEKLELKQQVFADFERHVTPEAILASNTSGIPITKIAEKLEHPERVIGTHWSNPPHLIPMIEIIPGERTSPEVTATTQELVRQIGYYPCTLKKEVPGFVENRVLYAIMRECLALVDEGVVDAEELDLNVKWGIGYKLAVVPPMALLDMAGLDIYNAVASYLNPDLSDEKGVSSTITERVEQGKLGIKSGAGLFEYDAERAAQLQKERAAALVAVRKALS
ncbi:MAG: 3-hydroxybutyryl-CoA dehydrogenase [Thermoleophilaceae bacterium]|jgi:3-hydroxybutyryl-CoA dehydrogenase/5-formyl-3-hydroxy-2-methylpyridine 4-carboxylate dehydrogenase|nr:3-hydroxybutyryl-CoA dehydrogenase [Thermoleophilaceae bacterium]MEA2409146.1 3-hydroxybutyryl-CoA dehydrogenase [Thermoleophilaceae bacterium]